ARLAQPANAELSTIHLLKLQMVHVPSHSYTALFKRTCPDDTTQKALLNNRKARR
ncbi:hypothetical protein E4U53_001946, partial [Claviceps sorghi]